MITHVREPGPTEVWNPVDETYDHFDDQCMRCGSLATHRSRIWVWRTKWRLRKRLRRIRVQMDLTAHQGWVASSGLMP